MTELAGKAAGPRMSLTVKVMIGMVSGIIVGLIFNQIGSDFIATYVTGGLFAMIGKMFVNALKMLVVPLVFFSLICGVAGIGEGVEWGFG